MRLLEDMHVSPDYGSLWAGTPRQISCKLQKSILYCIKKSRRSFDDPGWLFIGGAGRPRREWEKQCLHQSVLPPSSGWNNKKTQKNFFWSKKCNEFAPFKNFMKSKLTMGDKVSTFSPLWYLWSFFPAFSFPPLTELFLRLPALLFMAIMTLLCTVYYLYLAATRVFHRVTTTIALQFAFYIFAHKKTFFSLHDMRG